MGYKAKILQEAEFRSPLDVRLDVPHANDGTGQWILLQPLIFYSSLAGKEITAPEGFSTDFASVPKGVAIWGLFGGRYARPAVIHDYCVRQRVFVRREKADRLFLEAMRLENSLELKSLQRQGVDYETIQERSRALEGRCYTMYLAVLGYTKTGLWKQDFDKSGYTPVG